MFENYYLNYLIPGGYRVALIDSDVTIIIVIITGIGIVIIIGIDRLERELVNGLKYTVQLQSLIIILLFTCTYEGHLPFLKYNQNRHHPRLVRSL